MIKIKSDARIAIIELIEKSGIKEGEILVIGCSSSEMTGGIIGKSSAPEAAEALLDAIYPIIKEKNMSDYIEMTGFIDNIEAMKLMNMSKIYVLPSYEESFSLTCVEAMQNKLPIVSFDTRTGPKILVKNEENGFLVEDGNIDLFVKRLIYLMKNEDIRIFYGKNGYIYSDQFVEKSVIDKWLSLFNREI